MAPRKYRRIINPSVSVPRMQPEPIGSDDETQDSNWETQVPPTPISGLDAHSTPTAQDLDGEPSHTTLMAQPPDYKKGEVMSIDENGLRQNRSVTGPGDIWALRGGVRVVIKMNDVGQVIGLGSEKFPRFCSSLVRTSDLCPLMPNDWRCVPNEKKENMWNIIQRKFYFETNLTQEAVQNHAYSEFKKRRREYKYELKASLKIQLGDTAEHVISGTDPETIINHEDFVAQVRYWCDPKVQMKALKNKERWANQTILHTSGSKSFARLHFEEESRSGKGPDRSSLFAMTHTHKDGTPVNTKVAEKIAIIKDLMSKSPPLTQGYKQGCISWDPNDPYGQAFGKERPGRVRGVGVGCKSGSVASLTSSSMPQVCCNDPEHAGVSDFMKEFQVFKTLFANSHASQMGNVPNFNNDYTPVLPDCVTNANCENNEDHCEEEANA